MKKVAPLRYGVIFKKAFSDPFIFKAFAEDILGITLEIDTVETEKEFDPAIGYVAARFDLFAEDKKNRVIVEIQHVRNPDHYDRFLYYHCVAMLQQVSKFDNYKPNLAVYTIVVLTSGDKHKEDVAIIDFDPKTRSGRSLGEMRHKLIFLCPKYVNDSTPEPYREWLRAINDTLDEEVDESGYQQEAIQRVFEMIERDLVSPQERARLIEENQQQAQFDTGRAEGVQQGRQAAVRETVRNLLAQGVAVAVIMAATGLTEGEINALSNDLS